MNPRRVAMVVVAILVLWVAVTGGVILHFFLPILHHGRALGHDRVRYRAHNPIPNDSKAHTQAEFDATLRAFHHRTIVKAYERSGIRSPKWDAAAIRFLEGYSDRLLPHPGSPTKEKVAADGQTAIAEGCTDPLVESCAGVVVYELHGYPNGVALLEQSLRGFEKGAYTGCRARIVPDCLIQMKLNSGKPASKAETKRLQDLEIRWSAQSLTDGSYNPGEDRIAISDFLTNVSDLSTADPLKDRWVDLSDAIERNGSKFPYAAKTIAGICHVYAAWECRGSGWASSVTAKGWKGFYANLRVAREKSLQAWKLKPEYPEAPANMIVVSYGGDAGKDDSPLTWFDRAVVGQMDYSLAYDHLMTALLPRWGGGIQDLYNFGVDCSRTRRYDTDVPMRFLYALQTTSSESGGDKYYWKLPQTGKLLDETFDGYAKSGHCGSPDLLRSKKAAAAWYCGRYSEARHTLDDLGGRVKPEVFKDMFGVSYQDARAQIYSASGKNRR